MNSEGAGCVDSQERGNSKLKWSMQGGERLERPEEQPSGGQVPEGSLLLGFRETLDFTWCKAVEAFEFVSFFRAASLKLLYTTHDISWLRVLYVGTGSVSSETQEGEAKVGH